MLQKYRISYVNLKSYEDTAGRVWDVGDGRGGMRGGRDRGAEDWL
jgi:hypothetical protein